MGRKRNKYKTTPCITKQENIEGDVCRGTTWTTAT